MDDKEVDKINKKPWYKNWKIISLLLAISIVLVFNFNYAFVLIVGPSMEPSYYDSNIVLGEKNYKYLQRFDVVVIYSDEAQKSIIKRIIGLPGETVEYKNNELYINDKYIEDIYNYGGTNDLKVTLNENSYFCLGDNRTNSADSRTYGSFSKNNIFAKIKDNK